MYTFGGHSSAVVLESMGDFHSMFSLPMGSRLHTAWAEWEGGDVEAGMGVRSRRPTCIFAPPLCPAASGGGREGEAAGSIEQESRGGERGREIFLLTKMGFNHIPAENEFLSSPRCFFLRVFSPDFPAGWVFFCGEGRSSQVTPLNRPERRKEEGKKSTFSSSNFDLEFREVRSDATASRERKGVRSSSVRSGRFPHP